MVGQIVVESVLGDQQLVFKVGDFAALYVELRDRHRMPGLLSRFPDVGQGTHEELASRNANKGVAPLVELLGDGNTLIQGDGRGRDHHDGVPLHLAAGRAKGAKSHRCAHDEHCGESEPSQKRYGALTNELERRIQASGLRVGRGRCRRWL
jgi:hypothetical protein